MVHLADLAGRYNAWSLAVQSRAMQVKGVHGDGLYT